MANSKSGASEKPTPRMFSPAMRVALLAQRIGAPTDVKVAVGGVEFTLRPLSTDEALQIFNLIDEVATLSGGLKNIESVDGAELAAFLASRGKEVVALVKSVLRRAAEDMIEGDGGESVFDEWFKTLDLLPTVRTLFPKVIEANGLTNMINRPQKPAVEAVAPEESPGTPSMPSATS